jgi:diguanylate cyclase (GGDEF)-like protein
MRMNVGGRIALTIGVLVLVTLAVGASTFFTVKKLESGIDHYTEVYAPRERAAFEMQTSLAEYGRLVTVAASSGDELPEGLSVVAARFEDAAIRFMELPGNSELAGLGGELRGRISELDGQARAVLSASGEKRRAKFGEFQLRYQALSDLLQNDILPLVQRQRANKVSFFQRLARQPILALALLIGTAGILGAMAAIVLLRGVLYPLDDLLKQTDVVSVPGEESFIEIAGDDEHRRLAEAFNSLLQKQRATEQAMEELAHHDPLTRLPNRLLFAERLEEMLEHARRLDRQVAVYLIDLDNFKDLNDSLGHASGDALLLQVAKRLTDVSRDTDIVARLGGDEFAIIQTNINHPDGVTTFAERVISCLIDAYEVNDGLIHSTASIGVTIFPDDDKKAAMLLQNAELALYRAKQDGRGKFQLFNSAMQDAVRRRHVLERELRIALDTEQFEIHYQPRYRVSDRAIVGAEALVRWNHPKRGAISPAEFIPVAESSGLVTRITEFVLNEACAQIGEWSRNFDRPLTISVNLSPVDFRRPDIVTFIEQILREIELPPQQLEIEITEGMVMYGAELVRERLTDIRALGVTLAIDDFGTGFSSMSYLKTFPVDSLKIDQTFVAGIPSQREDIAITMAIIRLAHSLNLTTVAEGVETDAQLEFLTRRNCDQVQGYLLSRPVSAEDLTALLQTTAAATIEDTS